jgi:hypothetical protein
MGNIFGEICAIIFTNGELIKETLFFWGIAIFFILHIRKYIIESKKLLCIDYQS